MAQVPTARARATAWVVCWSSSMACCSSFASERWIDAVAASPADSTNATMFGATAYDLFKARDRLSADGATIIAIGFVVSFLSALAIIKPFLAFVARQGLVPFAYYRIGLGALIFALLAAGMGDAGS